MARDNRTCVYCGAPATKRDHVKPIAEDGSDDESNLVASCRACNERKRIEESNHGRRRTTQRGRAGQKP